MSKTKDLFGTSPRTIGYERAQDAADRADRVIGSWSDSWSDRAESIARRFIAMRGSQPFLSSDIIEYAQREGLPQPPEKRAWGAIIHSLSRRKAIIATGRFVEYPGRTRHGAPAREWRRA